MRFTSTLTVDLIQHMGDDDGIAHAARVSTKGARAVDALRSDERIEPVDPARNHGLINMLMRDRHGSPFEHAAITFFVHAPIFVWRELMRHRIASYNEESSRYKQLDPVFYVPARDRNLVQTGKAATYSFHPGTDEQHALVTRATEASCRHAYDAYQAMLDQGIAREVARGVLPVSIYSSAYVTMNPRALMNFLSLRVKSDESRFPSNPQWEINAVANQIEAIFADLFPVTHAAFVANGRVAP